MLWLTQCQATHIVDELVIRIGILLHRVAELDAMQSLCGGACEAGCHGCWCRGWSWRGCRHRGRGGGHRGRLHGEVAGCCHGSTIHQVSSLCGIERGWQGGTRRVHIRLHGLRMVQCVSCCIHRCAIWEVANGVDEFSPWQRRSRSVRIWSNGLRVVDGVASPVHWCAVWQIASVLWCNCCQVLLVLNVGCGLNAS